MTSSIMSHAQGRFLIFGDSLEGPDQSDPLVKRIEGMGRTAFESEIRRRARTPLNRYASRVRAEGTKARGASVRSPM